MDDMRAVPEPLSVDLLVEVFRRTQSPTFLFQDEGEDFRCVAVNGAGAALLGRDESELIGSSIGAAFPSLDRTVVPTLLRDVAAGDPAADLGRVVLAESAEPGPPRRVWAFSLQGRRVGLAFEPARGDDADDDLDASFFRALVEGSNDFVALAALDGRVLYVNPAGRALIGIPDLETARRSTIPDFLTGDGRRQLLEVEQPAVVRAGFWHGESTLRHGPTGEAIDVLVNSFLVRDLATGEPLALATVQRDIRLRKSIERERRLLEEQLHESQKLEAIGALAGGIAHDFNNVLTAILGHAHLLLADPRPDHDAHCRARMRAIEAAADHAAALTRQLLAYSRRQVRHLETLDVNAAVVGVHSMLGRLIEERIELRLDLGAALPAVEADRAQIAQVITNLVLNARDAIPATGTIGIRTRAVVLDEAAAVADLVPGRYVQLTVSDDGVGMDEETVSRVFEPFFTTKSEGKGTGLGLSTVYGIVKQTRGHIDVTSAPGAGTAVDVHLPASARLARPAGVEPAALPGAGRRIVLVEDEEVVRAVVAEILVRAGHVVVHAASGEEALALVVAGRGEVDVVVSDIVMPGIGGLELARRLEGRVPVVLMTGFSVDLVHESVPGERVRVLAKPFSAGDLLRTIDEVVG